MLDEILIDSEILIEHAERHLKTVRIPRDRFISQASGIYAQQFVNDSVLTELREKDVLINEAVRHEQRVASCRLECRINGLR
jgi:hypothetical protein